MRKILGTVLLAMSLMGGATVLLAQSSRDLTPVTGTEANQGPNSAASDIHSDTDGTQYMHRLARAAWPVGSGAARWPARRDP
jgi:hypothetical protein